MHTLRIGLLLSALALCVARQATAQDAVSVMRQDQTPVPLMVYPAAATACRGVAIISHGAGGSERGYRYLGQALSSIGYLAIVVGHRESGAAALRQRLAGNRLRDALAHLLTDPAAYQGRFMDIAAARAWAGPRCDGPESVLVGHSMGAATVMLAAGARNTLGLAGTDAFGAYIAISPQGVGAIFPVDAWSGIRRPMLLLTGTRDDDLDGASWEARTAAFDSLPAGCKALGVIRGATHMHFAGIGASGAAEALTTRLITDFLDGARRGDCKLTLQHPDIDIRSCTQAGPGCGPQR